MKLRPLLIALAAAASLVAGKAFALTFEGASSAGASTVTDYSADGLLAFDIDLRDFKPITLNFRVAAGDLGAPIDFNSLVRNLSGNADGLPMFRFGFIGTTVSAQGSVTRFFGGDTQVLSAVGDSAIALAFTPAEYLDIEVGNALGSTPGGLNWQLSSQNLRAGDLIQVVAVVPEPGSLALMALGLAGLGALQRRRRA